MWRGKLRQKEGSGKGVDEGKGTVMEGDRLMERVGQGKGEAKTKRGN